MKEVKHTVRVERLQYYGLIAYSVIVTFVAVTLWRAVSNNDGNANDMVFHGASDKIAVRALLPQHTTDAAGGMGEVMLGLRYDALR